MRNLRRIWKFWKLLAFGFARVGNGDRACSCSYQCFVNKIHLQRKTIHIAQGVSVWEKEKNFCKNSENTGDIKMHLKSLHLGGGVATVNIDFLGKLSPTSYYLLTHKSLRKLEHTWNSELNIFILWETVFIIKKSWQVYFICE